MLNDFQNSDAVHRFFSRDLNAREITVACLKGNAIYAISSSPMYRTVQKGVSLALRIKLLQRGVLLAWCGLSELRTFRAVRRLLPAHAVGRWPALCGLDRGSCAGGPLVVGFDKGRKVGLIRYRASVFIYIVPCMQVLHR